MRSVTTRRAHPIDLLAPRRDHQHSGHHQRDTKLTQTDARYSHVKVPVPLRSIV